MRALALFIYKNHFFFLFLVLQTLCGILMVRSTYYQRAGIISSANTVTGTIKEYASNIQQYVGLAVENKRLAGENARMHNNSSDVFERIKTGKTFFNDTIYRQKYHYIEAKVVSNSINRRNNYLTLNIGSAQGVKKDMAVICADGVVGIVKDVSENFSSVMSVLHKNTHISSRLKKDGSFGPLSWEEGDGYQYATLNDIPTHAKLAKGDTVITSSYSTIFPEGIMVGTVEDFTIHSGEHFNTVRVKLSVDFTKLVYVYVVGNLLKEEQEQLEKVSQSDKDK